MQKNEPELTPEILRSWPEFKDLAHDEAEKLTEKLKQFAQLIFNHILRSGELANI